MRWLNWWRSLLAGAATVVAGTKIATALKSRTKTIDASAERDETERVRRIYDKAANHYDRAIGLMEKFLLGGGRRWVCSQSHGDVLEIAIGTGRNLPYYPSSVSLTGIDLSPDMLAIARHRAEESGRNVALHVGDAQALGFPDGQFDTVVSTLSLCTIPDERRAVAEVRRVLRPGGRFLMLEHVRSPVLPARTVQRMLDPLVVRLQADHLLREPLQPLRAEGFEIERIERSKWGIIERVSARKPA
jgi:ubiquinone/menaquinone biosynthesis C-methylase UbiE